MATTANGTQYCRTCGFADCPGATTGDCPRWSAREAAAEAEVQRLIALMELTWTREMYG